MSELPSFAESASFQNLLEELRDSSSELNDDDAWPAEQLHAMSEAGVLGWLIPEEFGGGNISNDDLTVGYEKLAAACLASTFVLTQRNAAIQRIVRSENQELKRDLLPKLATDSLFATVGISHLTTSRQHLRTPAVSAEQVDAGVILNGEVPWVTGADKADVIVCGGTLEDNTQVLVALETSNEGVEVAPAVPLMALNSSRTSTVRLNNVFVPLDYLLHGPIENVMKQTGGGAGSYTTSALAVGHAANAIRLLGEEADRRPELNEILQPFADEHTSISSDLSLAASEISDTPPHLTAEAMRQRSNSLALRSSQACLAASKGAGFVASHPASRLVAEAMFFLVWSCPQPVVLGNLRELACSGNSGT
ncbi:MAG: alkylation response protein AidB-like acyl-CoA dehydrogenase [Planctomycetaceae bacterium]|jgi:alkylation response protein AidB-like acyl-CoA dehydrogenase